MITSTFGPCADCGELHGGRYRTNGGLEVCWPCWTGRNPLADQDAALERGISGVVVMASPKGTMTTTTRYAGRRVDVREMLSRPPQPIPWRVHDVVADGTLTIISGEAGAGKSWLLQGMCTGVAHGRTTAGLLCNKGKALYVDGEMGASMFVDQRIRPTGATAADFELIDVMGLDLSTPHDFKWFEDQIVDTGANFVGVDSLRRLAPSKAENDSDAMAPVVSAFAKLARDTNAAIVVVHHKGDGEKFWRGSSAIRDQADALFGLLRDDEDGDVRRLSCGKGKGKMRYAPEPPDRFLVIDVEAGGVAEAEVSASGAKQSMLDIVKAQILAALPAKTKTAVAKKIHRELDDSTFKRAWAALYEAGTIAAEAGHWVVVVMPDPRDPNDHHPGRLTLIEGGGSVA